MKVNFKPSSIVNKILFKYSKEDLIKLKKSGFKLRILKNKTNLKNLLKYTKVKEKLLKKKSVIKQNIKNQNMNRTFTFIKSSNEPLIKSKDDILFKKLLDGLNNNFNEKKIIENKRKVQFNKQKKEFYDNKNNNNNYKKKDVKDKESVKEFNNSIIDILSKVVEKKKTFR